MYIKQAYPGKVAAHNGLFLPEDDMPYVITNPAYKVRKPTYVHAAFVDVSSNRFVTVIAHSGPKNIGVHSMKFATKRSAFLISPEL